MSTQITDSNYQEESIILLKEGISKGRHPEFQIASNSMSPFLKIGDKISLKEIPSSELSCGDVIVYNKNKRLIAHRFLRHTDNSSFVTKGDNLSNLDEPISADRLIGKVYLIEKKDVRINLEEKKWRLTNLLLGKACVKELECLNKNIIIKLIFLLGSQLIKIVAKLINPTYRKISREEKYPYFLEKEFLKIATQKKLSAKDLAALKVIADKGINWASLLALTEYNSVAPLIYANLSQLSGNFIPEEILESLKTDYTQSFLKTAPIYDDISKLLKEFNAVGIKAIVLKGCSLGELLYEDFSLRPMQDIDILVKKDDWPKIREILVKLGFKNEQGLDLLVLENLLGVPADWHLCYKNDRGTITEFKFNIFVLDFPDFVNIMDYWKEALPIEINGTEALSLSLEDQLLHLCCRLIKVGFKNILFFCDLREFINYYHEKINWQKVVEKAMAKRVGAILYFSLLILKEKMACDLPPEIFKLLKPNLLRRQFFRNFYNYKNAPFNLPEAAQCPDQIISLCIVFGKVKFSIKVLKKFIIYLKSTLFPSLDYLNYRYKITSKSNFLKDSYYRRIYELLDRLLDFGRIIFRKIF